MWQENWDNIVCFQFGIVVCTHQSVSVGVTAMKEEVLKVDEHLQALKNYFLYS